MAETPRPRANDITENGKTTTGTLPQGEVRRAGRSIGWFADEGPKLRHGEAKRTTDNPFGVSIPDTFATYAPLISSRSDFIGDFTTYYRGQLDRIKTEGMPVKLEPQQAFNREVENFVTITRGVTSIAQKEVDTPLIVVSDLDWTAGSVVERLEPIRLPGLPDLRYEQMNPQQKEQHRQLSLKSIYDDFAFSPGYIQAVRYLHTELGSGIKFGISSTKAQEGMSKYLHPTLEELFPGAFDEMLIFSSAGGAMDELVPEIASITRDRKNPPTMRRALTAFIEHSPEGQELPALRTQMAANEDEQINQILNEPVSDFDKKLFLNLRMLQNLRAAVAQQYSRLPEATGDEPWIENLLPADACFVLLDDARVPAKLFKDHSLQVITVKPVLLPDDPARRRIRKKNNK